MNATTHTKPFSTTIAPIYTGTTFQNETQASKDSLGGVLDVHNALLKALITFHPRAFPFLEKLRTWVEIMRGRKSSK
jgi:hypothetical protein